VAILKAVGEWMRKNGDSIYGCGHVELPKPDYGRITGSADGKRLYVHVLEQTVGPVPVEGVRREDIKRVRLLSTGAELSLMGSWASANYPEFLFIRLDQHGAPSYLLPDATDTVIMIELK
jgi:alpha-L-fucosidase